MTYYTVTYINEEIEKENEMTGEYASMIKKVYSSYAQGYLTLSRIRNILGKPVNSYTLYPFSLSADSDINGIIYPKGTTVSISNYEYDKPEIYLLIGDSDVLEKVPADLSLPIVPIRNPVYSGGVMNTLEERLEAKAKPIDHSLFPGCSIRNPIDDFSIKKGRKIDWYTLCRRVAGILCKSGCICDVPFDSCTVGKAYDHSPYSRTNNGRILWVNCSIEWGEILVTIGED